MEYKGETHKWDLMKGDIGNFWHSFKDKDGVVHDINFWLDESGTYPPSLLVYELDEDEYIDTSRYEEIPLLATRGDVNDYLSLLLWT